MSEDKKDSTLNLSLKVDIENVSPSSATLIRQWMRGVLENFARAKLLKSFVEVMEIDRSRPEDA